MRLSESNSSLAAPAAAPAIQPLKRILFHVQSANVNIASVRYRAMFPAIGLRDLGFKCVVSDQELDDATLQHFHCIVFVKAFRFVDLGLALRAQMLGIPTVLDICDNIFVEDYGPRLGNEMATAFKIMAESASAIVTTGPALTSVVRQELLDPPPIFEICDPLETKTLLAAVQTIFRARRPLISPRALRAFRLLVHEPSKFTKVLKREHKSRRWFFSVIYGFGISLATLRIAAKKVAERIDRIVAKSTANDKPPAADPRPLKTLLWFGNHGAPYGDFGMLTLLPILPAIIRLAKKIPLRLIIVSNNEEKYRRYFSNLPFPTKYRDWHPSSIFDNIEAADVCLIPNSRDPFSLAKSSNRAILSLYYGTPVVATDIPSLEDIRHCIATDDWENGILTYLVDAEEAEKDIRNAQSVIEKKYSLTAIAQCWADLLNASMATKKLAGAPKVRPRVLIMVCGAPSAEVLVPIFSRLKTDPKWHVDLWVATEAIVGAPRILDMIDTTSTTIFFGTRKVVGTEAVRQPLDDSDMILVPAEELAWPSIAQVAAIARARNNLVCVVQSKLDPLGETAQTNSDAASASDAAPAPDRVLMWGNKRAHATPPASVPDKEISVGCPRAVARPGSDPSYPLYGQSYLAVVEDVYGDGPADRQAIVARTGKILEAFPDLHVVFVPRPVEIKVARSRFAPKQLMRMTVVDLDEGKNKFPLPRVLADAAMVITESPVIALDAARADRPVALIPSGDTAPHVAPLPLLSSTEEWITFVGDALEGRDDPQRRRSFVSETVSPGDPVEQIVAALGHKSCSAPKSGVAGATS